jgi:beta-xylosidase
MSPQERLGLWEQNHKSVIFVTHDVEEAILLSGVPHTAWQWILEIKLMSVSRFSIKAMTYFTVCVGGLLQAEPARNPVIWADVPDVAAIRVGDTYYMASTTMHMSPGLPIMKSKNLVNWELVGYAYDTLADNEALRLENGKNAYGRGSWAPSLRYHEGTFYASTFSSTSGRTHIYTTDDIEKGGWKEISFAPSLHDHSLFFDDDGRVYMLYGVGDLRLVELKPDLTGIREDGFNEVVIENASAVVGRPVRLRAEGTQILKVNGKYYVMNITWPRDGMRTQLVHRADKITGPYEGGVVFQDQGIAQGCLIDTPDGRWYALLFQDNGSVGRTPWLVPVRWEDGWPVLGIDGKAPATLEIDVLEQGLGNIVAADEFDRQPGQPLPLAWQWNHNPDNRFWSIGEREGFLRLVTGRVDHDLLQARNMLTQRTFGPTSSATTKIDVAGMKDGDCAGLIALQRKYGFVGVRADGEGKAIVMVSVQSDQPEVVARVPLQQQTVYLRIDCDFRDRTDKARFYYSLDAETWVAIGSTLQMAYTLPHFMGYRFGLFNFAARSPGGFADFDYYRISDELISGD